MIVFRSYPAPSSLSPFLHLRLPGKINQTLVLRASAQNKHFVPSPSLFLLAFFFLNSHFCWHFHVERRCQQGYLNCLLVASLVLLSGCCLTRRRCLSGSLCWFWKPLLLSRWLSRRSRTCREYGKKQTVVQKTLSAKACVHSSAAFSVRPSKIQLPVSSGGLLIIGPQYPES